MPARNPTKKCARCGKATDAPAWRIKVQDYACRACKRERDKPAVDRYLAKNRAKVNAVALAWCHRNAYLVRKTRATQKAKYPDKFKARRAITDAVRRGKLTGLPCEVCGNKRSEAHHYLGYAKENWLKVRWLCSLHHKAEGKRESYKLKIGSPEPHPPG